MSKLAKLTIILTITAIISMGLPWFCPEAIGKQPKSKFYDFGEQVIDGEINKPIVKEVIKGYPTSL